MKFRRSLIMLYFIAVALTIMTATSADADGITYQNEPDGFRGLKWGTNLKRVKGLTYLRGSGKLKTYIRKKEELTIGGAKLKYIFYDFYSGKFSSVTIICQGHGNVRALRAAIIEKFGYGNVDKGYEEELVWDGDTTRMMLVERNITGESTFGMTSKKILEQRWADEKAAAKEGASKGF